MAATRGATSAAVALLEADADPDLSIDNGETPLLAAIEGDFIQVVRALLSEEAEAPVRTADPNKGAPSSSVRQAPLLLAVARGRVAAAAARLEAGADAARPRPVAGAEACSQSQVAGAQARRASQVAKAQSQERQLSLIHI